MEYVSLGYTDEWCIKKVGKIFSETKFVSSFAIGIFHYLIKHILGTVYSHTVTEWILSYGEK